eukprot:226478-Chlamydomonas_euryale.AAC.1
MAMCMTARACHRVAASAQSGSQPTEWRPAYRVAASLQSDSRPTEREPAHKPTIAPEALNS